MIHIGIDNTAHMSNIKVNQKNDNSPRNCHVLSISTHSTPVEKNHCENKVEESPDYEYYSSTILLSCTQEGGNEVAWDWQSSSNKTPSRSVREKVQCETPKRTRLLQKKRNSNSPLLYKPLKRKSVKMENIENIGQFAAELQALNERMKSIKQDDKKRLDDDVVEEDTITAANVNNEKGLSEIKDDENYNKKNNDCNNVNNATASYDDLFDDSIDDSMAKCTQEIEEKFNLIADKGNSNSTNFKEETSAHTSNTTDQISLQFACAENSQEFPGKSFFHKGIEDNNTLKTYSKTPKKPVNGVNEISEMWKDKNQYKSWTNNNKIHSHIDKPSNHEISSKNITTKLFDIPDDSFDDCLATCIEDDRLLAVDLNDSSTRKNSSTKAENNCKSSTNVSLKGKTICNNYSLGTKSIDSLKSTVKVQTCNDKILENRKFFKTKSLSDQYIGRDTSINTKYTSNSSVSCNTMKSTLHLSKSSMTQHINATRSSVSTNPILMNKSKAEGSAISRDMGQTYEFDVNRSAVKEGGNRFIRYNSTGNMKSEIRKTDIQPTRCTAEEIEKKRLQAKMKLEARKKLHSMKITNHVTNR